MPTTEEMKDAGSGLSNGRDGVDLRRRGRGLKAVAKKSADEKTIRRQAKLLDAQRKTLGDISLEAIKIATMQLAVSKLEEGLRLLRQAGISGVQMPIQAAPAAAPVAPAVQNPCAMCGREGVYQAKARDATTGQLLPLNKRPFYCAAHAQWARQQDGEDDAVRRNAPTLVAPSTPPAEPAAPAPVVRAVPQGLNAAMAQLKGQA